MQGKPEQRVVAGRWSLPQSPGPPPARAAPSTVLPAAVALRRAVTEQRGRWGGAESGLGLGGGRNGTLPTDGSCSPLPSLPGPSFRTFVLSWVINVEVPVPHDCQLHRQVVDLHPFVGILQPGPEGKEKAGSQRFLGWGWGAMFGLVSARVHGVKGRPRLCVHVCVSTHKHGWAGWGRASQGTRPGGQEAKAGRCQAWGDTHLECGFTEQI